jgi:Bacterial PH domain
LRLSPRFPLMVENYLVPRERAVIAVRKHPGAFISHLLLLGCCSAAACLITVLTDSGPLVLGAAWAVFLAVLVWLLIRVSAWFESYFVATEVRLIFITGLVTPKVVSVPLREIASLEKRRSPLGRLVGYGELIAKPVRPGYTIPKMDYLPYFEQLLTEMQNVLHPGLADDTRD